MMLLFTHSSTQTHSHCGGKATSVATDGLPDTLHTVGIELQPSTIGCPALLPEPLCPNRNPL